MSDKALSEILSPATLAKIDNYHLIAKIVIEGFISGIHRSVYHGIGSEFMQYRNYSPGDDLKYIDWKVLGRLDKFHTKVFQEETNFNCSVILDASSSMAYQGNRSPCSKFRYGAMFGACLAYLAARQGDNIGFFSYGGEIKSFIPPGRKEGHLNRIISEISRIKPHGMANHGAFLPHIAKSVRRKGLIVLISDFLDVGENITSLLKNLRISRNDCIVMQVLDADELDFPFRGSVRFFDSESEEHILTAPDNVRSSYVHAMDDYINRVKKACLDIRADYICADTSKDLGEILSAYLHRRGSVY